MNEAISYLTPRRPPTRWMRNALAASVTIFVALASTVRVNAQTQAGQGAATAPPSVEAEANNPLAKFQAFNMHNYYIPALSEADGQNANTFWFRYAQPLGKFLFRASLPVSRVPTGVGTTTSGLGDVNAFAAYLFDTGDPAVSVGVGPQFTVPTATETEAGTGKWLGGFAATFFNSKSRTLQWGGLLTWQKDFAGDDDRSPAHVLALQPFYFFQIGNGLYLRGAPVAVFNLEDDSYNVPMALGLGKVIPSPGAVFNIWIESQYTVLSKGANQPELQIFVGFNTQFVKK